MLLPMNPAVALVLTIASGCWSLAPIVSLAFLGVLRVAPCEGALSLRAIVSGPSGRASGKMVTGNDLDVSPAANDRVPEVAMKSLPAVAVLAAAEKCKDTGIRGSPP